MFFQKTLNITLSILLMLISFNPIYAQSNKQDNNINNEITTKNINNWNTADKNNYQLLEGSVPDHAKDNYEISKILDHLYSVDDQEDLEKPLPVYNTPQGGISSKNKLSFKEDFNISFKSVIGGYGRLPNFRGNSFSVGFHQDTSSYINKEKTKFDVHREANLTAGIAGVKNSFALIVDYELGGGISTYTKGTIYLADTTTKTNNKKDFKKLSPISNMWWNKQDYVYNGYNIREKMAVANVSITWNAKNKR